MTTRATKALTLALLVGCGGDADPGVDASAVSDAAGDGAVDGVSDGGIDSTLDLINHMEPAAVCVGATAAIHVRLNYYPGSTITVMAYSSNAAKITVSPTSLTFTSANWNVSQDFIVSGVASGGSVVTLGAVNYRAVEIFLLVNC